MQDVLAAQALSRKRRLPADLVVRRQRRRRVRRRADPAARTAAADRAHRRPARQPRRADLGGRAGASAVHHPPAHRADAVLAAGDAVDPATGRQPVQPDRAGGLEPVAAGRGLHRRAVGAAARRSPTRRGATTRPGSTPARSVAHRRRQHLLLGRPVRGRLGRPPDRRRWSASARRPAPAAPTSGPSAQLRDALAGTDHALAAAARRRALHHRLPPGHPVGATATASRSRTWASRASRTR